jgi:hypothetical protein
LQTSELPAAELRKARLKVLKSSGLAVGALKEWRQRVEAVATGDSLVEDDMDDEEQESEEEESEEESEEEQESEEEEEEEEEERESAAARAEREKREEERRQRAEAAHARAQVCHFPPFFVCVFREHFLIFARLLHSVPSSAS